MNSRISGAVRALLLLVLVGCCGFPAVTGAQSLVWERVGSNARSVSRPSMASDGTMWASGYYGVVRMAPPYGPATPWVAVYDDFNQTQILALGPDTLVTGENVRPYRSVDGGLTFAEAAASAWASPRALIEVPLGLPNGGVLVAGASNAFALFSHDRGATWARSTILNSGQEYPHADALAVVRTGPRAGRVVGAGSWGLATSDDGGTTFAPVPGFWQHFRFYGMAVAVLEGSAPGGGDRLAATLIDPQHVPDTECIIVVSDDGGDTWRETADLTGDPNAYGRSIVDFGGGRAVVVMNGGHVWSSDDAGETWTRLDTVVPGATMDPAGSPTNGLVKWAMRGPDGRLYVGGIRLGGADPGWAFRTVTPFVAGEAGPNEAAGGVVVSVRPNPASGRAEVVVSLAAAQAVRVVVMDALGREVAVLLDGETAAGERVAGVDTSAWPVGVYVARAAATGAGGADVATARLVVAR